VGGVGWNDWIRTVEVEPSLYAADFSRLGEQIDMLVRAGVRILHFDVGDGHFVEPITMGPIVLQSISKLIHDGGAFVDCHLMTEHPAKHFAAIKEAGGDSVTVHYEACDDLPNVVRAARELELQIGLAFKPETGATYAAHAALSSSVDLVLVMSIEPGYSGQEFMPEALDRIRTVRSIVPEDMPIQVDGGIGPENIRRCREAGATLFVAGTSIFGREDLPRAYRRLVEELA
jgi:ribulose-phosphate 3-epimerase